MITATEAPTTADVSEVQLFKVLSDATRLKILSLLSKENELCVLELGEILGHTQPLVSHHLAMLLEIGLIRRRPQGRHNYYSMTPGRLHQLVGDALKKYE